MGASVKKAPKNLNKKVVKNEEVDLVQLNERVDVLVQDFGTMKKDISELERQMSLPAIVAGDPEDEDEDGDEE